MNASKMKREKARWKLHRNGVLNESWKHTPQNSCCTATCHSSHKPSKKDEQDCWGSKDKLISNILCGLLHMDILVLANQ